MNIYDPQRHSKTDLHTELKSSGVNNRVTVKRAVKKEYKTELITVFRERSISMFSVNDLFRSFFRR